jgi:hypothetical protein
MRCAAATHLGVAAAHRFQRSPLPPPLVDHRSSGMVVLLAARLVEIAMDSKPALAGRTGWAAAG